MKIAKYVGDLLYDYECVVIPGLGGFITKDSSVSINEVTHNFSPPFRNVYFNIHLRANDGLLVNHVAQQEQIGYKTAKQRVDKFAFQCHNALKTGKKIRFKNIGSIYYDNENNIIFTQETKFNYNPNSFGLGNLVSPAIRRVTDEQKVKKVVKSAIEIKKSSKKPVDRRGSINREIMHASRKNMQANKRKSSFTNQIIFLLAVIFFMGSGYMYIRREAMKFYFDRHASSIPFFYASINDYLSTNINSSHVAQLSRSTASFFPTFSNTVNENVIEEKTENSEKITEPKAAVEEIIIVGEQPIIEHPNGKSKNIFTIDEDNTTVEKSGIDILESDTPDNKVNSIVIAGDNIFVIAGSFSKESNAKSLVLQLKKQGYDALIADINKYGMYRVAFMSFSNRKLAENKLLAIRNETNPEAWILVKR